MTPSVRIDGERWSLLQALAWVMKRDEDLTAAASPSASDGDPRDPLWLIIRTAPNGSSFSMHDAWQELAAAIVSGCLAADGRPDRADGELTDRTPLTVEARDLSVDGERSRKGRECFLAGDSLGQRSWFDVELSQEDVMRNFPGAGGQLASGLCRKVSARPGKEAAVQNAVVELWPTGVPAGYPAKSRADEIAGLLRTRGISVSGATIRRALSSREQK